MITDAGFSRRFIDRVQQVSKPVASDESTTAPPGFTSTAGDEWWGDVSVIPAISLAADYESQTETSETMI